MAPKWTLAGVWHAAVAKKSGKQITTFPPQTNADFTFLRLEVCAEQVYVAALKGKQFKDKSHSPQTS